MKKGRVAVLYEVGKPLEFREYQVPDPQDGEVVIECLRTNICGSDIHMFKGEAFSAFGGLFYPIVLGHEFVGRVFKIGKGVKTDSLGNPISEGTIVSPVYYKGCGSCHLCSDGREYACFRSLLSVLREAEKPPYFVGAFSEFYVIRAGQKFYTVPSDIPVKYASAVNCALSQVIFGLNQIGLRYGESVVIQGAGGLGLLATAVAKDMGASKVVVVDSVENRLELARDFGADYTVNLNGDFRERVSKIKEVTGGGADVVVELAGTPIAIKEGMKYIKRGGRYLVMGAVNPKQKFDADPSVWIGENITIKGVSLYSSHSIVMAYNFIQRNKNKVPFDKIFAVFEFEKVNEAISSAVEKKYPRVQILINDT